MEKLLNIRELADRLGISKLTAYHWLSQGRLPCIRFSARCVRFRESDIENMLEQMQQDQITPERKTKKNR
jgi:excisionase family DNA binding protein